jgi:hypothetical protein
MSAEAIDQASGVERALAEVGRFVEERRMRWKEQPFQGLIDASTCRSI